MPMPIRLADLADKLDVTLHGDGEFIVSGIASLQDASASDLSFLSSQKFEKFLAATNAGAVILKQENLAAFSGNALVVEDPYKAYAEASAMFDPRLRRAVGIHASAVVSESAKIAASASIGAHCVIGDNVEVGEGCEIYPGVVIAENCHLGNDCLLYANVTLYSDVRIGCNVIIHSSTSIGSDGFGFAPSKDGWVKIHQLGGVEIGNNVEIGAGTAIDRGTIGDTVIHDGVIIDNQVHMAHNVEVGENTAIAGCVGIAGSTKIGKNCTFAGAVAVNGHIEIADNCHFNGGTIVTKGTKEAGAFASATPMQDVKSWRKSAVRFGQLDDLAGRIKKLEKINSLKI